MSGQIFKVGFSKGLLNKSSKKSSATDKHKGFDLPGRHEGKSGRFMENTWINDNFQDCYPSQFLMF